MLLQESFQHWNGLFSWLHFNDEVFTNFCQIDSTKKMKQISSQDLETYERVKHFMIQHKFSEEDLRRYVKHEVHLEVSFKGMETTEFESLTNAATFMGISKQSLTYAHKHKRPTITTQKNGTKVFFIEWLESMQHLSQLN